MFQKTALIIVSVLGLNGALGQVDTLFPNGGTRWIVGTHIWDGMGDAYDHYKCEILNDSIDTLGYTWSTMIDEQNDTVGLVMVDSGKIYYLSINPMDLGMQSFYDPGIYGMYDFNLELSDTAYFREGYPMIVDSINYTDFLGVSRRTLHLSGMAGWDIWVQGMGSIHGFFHPVFSTFESEASLCSFTGNYVDSLGQSYTLTHGNQILCESIGIEEFETTNPVLKRGNDWTEIQLHHQEVVSIYNMSGVLVFTEMFPEGISRITYSSFSKGLYIIKIGTIHSERISNY